MRLPDHKFEIINHKSTGFGLLELSAAAAIVGVFIAFSSSARAALSVNVSPTFTYMATDGGAGGYEAFPDLCRLQDGRLMGVFYAGYAHGSPPSPSYPNGGRIMSAFSSDEGATWTAPSVLYDGPLDDRDPSIAQLPDGQLICNFFQANTPTLYGTWLVRSDNAGVSWSLPEKVTTSDYYACSSPVRRLASGRLVMGLYYYTDSWANGAVTLSDDGGDTWSSPINIPTWVRLEAETDVIELKNGTLWAAERRNTPGAPMYYSTSTNAGATWSNSQPLGFHGESPYLHLTSQGLILMGYRGEGAGGAQFTALRYSLDKCATWSDPIAVDTTIGAYPSMVNLDDGSVLIAYYEDNVGSNSNVRVRRIEISGLPDPRQTQTVGYWRFNEKAAGQQSTGVPGEFIDGSGYGRHGYARGNPLPSYVAAPSGFDPATGIALTAKAGDYDPAEDRVVVPHDDAFNLMLADLTDYTIEADIKTTLSEWVQYSKPSIFSKGKGWESYSFRLTDTGQLSLYVQGANPNYTSSSGVAGNTVVADGNWHRVAVAIDADADPALTSATFYVDGVFDGMVYLTNAMGGSQPWVNENIINGSDVYIGDYYGTRVQQFVGCISSVKFSMTPVPEPSTVVLLFAGALGLSAYARRKRR